MIQQNLLPSIKAEYVKAQKNKRTIVVISTVVSVSMVTVVALLSFVAFGTQKVQLSNKQNDINTVSASIKDIKDLDKILTIQNQLAQLPQMHESKPIMSRLFTFIQQITPQSVNLDTIEVNNTDSTFSLEGKAPDFGLVNKFVDTIKFTEIAQPTADAPKLLAFSEVRLQEFSKSDSGYTFTIVYKFNPEIFTGIGEGKDKAEGVALVVPSITTTRSQVELPSADIFSPNPANKNEEQ